MTLEPKNFPPGELQVQISRPWQRFGLDLLVGCRVEDKNWIARVQEDGSLLFVPTDPATTISPTIHADERFWQKLKDALNEMPPASLGGQAAANHLEDAMMIRDRVMGWMETVIKRGDV